MASYNIQAHPLSADDSEQGYAFMLNLSQHWVSVNKQDAGIKEKISTLCEKLDMTIVWPLVLATQPTVFDNSLDALINDIIQGHNVVLAFFANEAPFILLDMTRPPNTQASIPCVQLHGVHQYGAFSSCLSIESLRNIMAELIRVGHQEHNRLSILIFRKNAPSINHGHKLSITDK